MTNKEIDRESTEFSWAYKNFDRDKAQEIERTLRQADYSFAERYLPPERARRAIRHNFLIDYTDHFVERVYGSTWGSGRPRAYWAYPSMETSLNEVKDYFRQSCVWANEELTGEAMKDESSFCRYFTLQDYHAGKVPRDRIFIGIDDFQEWKDFFFKCLEKRATFYECSPEEDLRRFDSRLRKDLIKYSREVGREDLVYRFAMIANSFLDFGLQRSKDDPSISNEIFEEAVKVAQRIGKERELSTLLRSRGWPMKDGKVEVIFRDVDDKLNMIYRPYLLNAN